MELIIIMLFVTVLFAVVVGISVMTRDEVPEVLIEEINDELDERRKEIEEEQKLQEEQ